MITVVSNKKTSIVITEVIMLMVTEVHSNWNQLLVEFSRWIQLSRGTTVVGYSTATHQNLA